MGFDIESWKTTVKERLRGWKERMNRAGVNSLYGFLSAATLWPVVEAARAGEWAALTALGSVLSGIGTGLITDRIKSWKNETDAARQIEADIEKKPDLRAELDTVLEKLTTFSHAQAALDTSEHAWFESTLRKELKRLGNLDRFQAQLTGIGAIAQGEQAIAAGPRGVGVGGDMRDNVIITGDRNVYYGSIDTLTIQSAVFQASPRPGEVDPKHLLWTYLNQVVSDTATLDLSGVDRKTASDQEEARLELAAVYTDLDTLRAVESKMGKVGVKRERFEALAREQKRQPVLEFISQKAYAALLGDPGSGKTTFANFLALCLAGELLGLENANLTRLSKACSIGPFLPIRVVLRNFAAQSDDRTGRGPGDQLWSYVCRHLGQSLADFVPLLNKYLLEEGGILILDGLDEVPEADHCRDIVKNAVIGFRRQFPKVRILLTSRTYAYQRQEWKLPDFVEAVLAPFTQKQINTFVDRWYSHMANVRSTMTDEDAQGRATLLKAAIERSPYLLELAVRPLLLTLMASLHAWRGGSLPEQREELYEQSVDLLLDFWERPKVIYDESGKPVVQTKSAAEWFNAPQKRIRGALEELALDAHRTQAELTGTANVKEGDLVTALLRVAAPDTRQARVIEYIRDRAGLLTNRAKGIYSFPHRTFQEYLAARHLTESSFPKRLVALVREDVERWREVLLLAGAKVARGTPYAAWSLVSKLCPQPCDAGWVGEAADSDWWAGLLAGQLLVETGIFRGEGLDADESQILGRVIGWIEHLVSEGHLPPVDRAAAGRALGMLGDPRSAVGVKDGLPEIDWVKVDEGPFIMGSREKDIWIGEPQFTCTLIRAPYRISRYLITVIQYRAFVEDAGYEQQQYWSEAGWKWCKDASVTGPRTFLDVFQTPNHPQVGVSWYEAVAFCGWLSERLGYRVSLPTEAQWERAARHTDGRTYPWDDEEDPAQCCNMEDTGVGSTTAVGIFPKGTAKCGACDMAGNVREWCRTKWLHNYADYEKSVDESLDGTARRVLHGGAFFNSGRVVRCAIRNWFFPDFRSNFVGFRVVLSPSSSGP